MSDSEILDTQEHKIASKEVNESAVEEEKVDVDASAGHEFVTKLEKGNSMKSKDENDGLENFQEPKMTQAKLQLLGGNYTYF